MLFQSNPRTVNYLSGALSSSTRSYREVELNSKFIWSIVILTHALSITYELCLFRVHGPFLKAWYHRRRE